MKGVFVVPTQFTSVRTARFAEDEAYWKSSGMTPHCKIKVQKYRKEILETAALLAKSNVKIAFGTDLGILSYDFNGAVEFGEMVANGITPIRAMRAATSVAAELLQRDDLGVLAPGKTADIIEKFVVKGKEAKEGQKYSIIVFVVVVLAIFGFNFYLFDKNDFLNMKWDTFLFKLLINAPLIWIATIANINLNKFSRLEQEYSHKEALAKSYERYKSEIQELEHLGVTGAEELKLKLLEINLEAFKVNPAEHSDKSKPDFSIWDLVRNRDDRKQTE